VSALQGSHVEREWSDRMEYHCGVNSNGMKHKNTDFLAGKHLVPAVNNEYLR